MSQTMFQSPVEEIIPLAVVFVPVRVVESSVAPDVSAAQLKLAMTWVASAVVPFVKVYGYDEQVAWAVPIETSFAVKKEA